MTKKTDESVEIMVARIDERVDHIHKAFPVVAKTVHRHDQELLVAKVIAVVGIVIVAIKFPVIAEAIGGLLK